MQEVRHNRGRRSAPQRRVDLAAFITTFQDRRDTAILRILIDTGMRVSGLANLRYDPDRDASNNVFLTQHGLRIRLEGGTRPRCRSVRRPLP
jgi:integrase